MARRGRSNYCEVWGGEGRAAWREKSLCSEVSSWLMGEEGGIETPAHNNAGDDIKTYTITAFLRHRETTSRNLQYSLLPPSANYFRDSCLMGGAFGSSRVHFLLRIPYKSQEESEGNRISSC